MQVDTIRPRRPRLFSSSFLTPDCINNLGQFKEKNSKSRSFILPRVTDLKGKGLTIKGLSDYNDFRKHPNPAIFHGPVLTKTLRDAADCLFDLCLTDYQQLFSRRDTTPLIYSAHFCS